MFTIIRQRQYNNVILSSDMNINNEYYDHRRGDERKCSLSLSVCVCLCMCVILNKAGMKSDKRDTPLIYQSTRRP